MYALAFRYETSHFLLLSLPPFAPPMSKFRNLRYRNVFATRFPFGELIKFVGGLAIFLPLVAGFFQYRQSVQQDLDKSYRMIVEDLSAKDKEKRLAAASNMGMFINRQGDYYDESVDVLINRLSIELDYSVLKAIRGSLEKVKENAVKQVIEKILSVERNFLNQGYTLSQRMSSARQAYWTARMRYQSMLARQFFDTVTIANLRTALNEKWKFYQDVERDSIEAPLHDQVVADFVTVFLRISERYPLEEIEFFQNSLNSATLIELKLPKSRIKYSAISLTNIWETDFTGSTIEQTLFSYSNFRKANFSNCTISTTLFDGAFMDSVNFASSTFSDVFFLKTSLTGTDFRGAKGLKPINFYRSDYKNAIFDLPFRMALDSALSTIDSTAFKRYVEYETDLMRSRKNQLLRTLRSPYY